MLSEISKHFKFTETHAGLCLGFFVGGRGKSILKEFFRRSKGVRGRAPPENFEKDSVQDWLKSHFWTLVIDALISSSNKISI